MGITKIKYHELKKLDSNVLQRLSSKIPQMMRGSRLNNL